VNDVVGGQPQAWVLRHGETEWSRNGRHTGRTDIPLTPDGREQALGVGRLLDDRSFAHVLVSPLGRAVDTCRLAGYGDQAEVDDDLLEWDYGDHEGIATPQIRETTPGWTIWTGTCPGGETLGEVAARADRVIARVLAAPGDVALFAHGHILRVLTARWCELDPIEGRRFPLDTGTVGVLGWEHEYPAVRRWNDEA
jgi:broad specificity phosphatase PhoE